MKQLKIILSVSFVVIASVAFAVEKPAKAPKSIKFLQLVLTANSGLVTKENNAYRLVLAGVNANVSYFTNRPRRVVGSMPTGYFLKRWIKPPPHDFVATPPNAAITYFAPAQETIIVTLMKPTYDIKKQQLQFTIQPLPGVAIKEGKIDKPVIFLAEVTICGTLGAWGNLPGEKQLDQDCHQNAEN